MMSRHFPITFLVAITGLMLGRWALGGAYYNLGAFMQSNAPASLVFTTTSPTLNTWSCTSKTVRRLDRIGRPSTVGATIVTLEGANAQYYSNSSCLPSSAITSITIASGSSTAGYYVSYATTGSQSTMASSDGLTSASQSSTVSLDPYTWTGGGADANWTTGGNWAGGSAPGSGNTAHFDGNCSTNCSATINSSAITVRGIRLHSSYAGTVTQASGVSFIASNIAAGFTQEGGTFVGSDGDITCSGTFNLAGGSFTSTSGTLSIGLSLTVSGTPAFSAANGTVAFPGGTGITLIPGTLNFNNVTLLKSAITTITGTLNVTGNLTLSTSNVAYVNGGTIVVSGNVISSCTSTSGGSTVIKLAGTGAQSLTGTSGCTLPSIEITSSGTVTLSGTIESSGNWTYTSGSVDPGTSTVMLRGSNISTISGSATFKHLNIAKANYLTIADTISVTGNLTLSTVNTSVSGSAILVSGDVIGSCSSTVGGGTLIKLAGTGAQSLTGTSGCTLPPIEIASSGTVTLSGTIELASTWTHTSGTVDPGTSTVTFRGSSTSSISGSATFRHLNIAKSSGFMTINDTVSVTGNLTLTTTGTAVNGATILVSGDVIGNCTSTAGGGTVLKLVGTGAQSVSTISGCYLPSIEIASSGTVSLSGTVYLTGNWTYTSGTVNPGTSTVSFKGSAATTISGAMTFKDLDIAKNAVATTITGTITVTGNLTLSTNNVAYVNGGTIAVSGNVTGSCTSTSGGTTVFKLAGTGAQTLSAISGCYLPSIEIASSGTVSLSGTINMTSNWTYTSGTVNAGTSLIQFNTGTAPNTINAGSMSFYDASFVKTTSSTITGTLKVSRNLILNLSAAAALNGGTIEIGGNLTLTNNNGSTGNTALSFVGTGAQTYTYAAGALPRGAVTVNKASGTLTLQSNMTLAGASQAFTISSGTVSLNGYTLSVGASPAGPMSVTGASSVLQCSGGCGAGTACGQGLGKLACGSLSVTSGGTVTP